MRAKEDVVEEHIHYKVGEKMSIVMGSPTVIDVTACAWENPPLRQLVIDKSKVTCASCLKRIAMRPW